MYTSKMNEYIMLMNRHLYDAYIVVVEKVDMRVVAVKTDHT